MTAPGVQFVVTGVWTDLARELLEQGCLSDHGLAYLRARLDAPGEWSPDDPRPQLLALDLDQVIADKVGAPLSDLPGRAVPDDPGDLTE